MRLPARRSVMIWVHLAMIPMFVWFLLVQPADVTPFGAAAFQAHSMLALVFVSLTLGWFADVMRRGLMGRPGPKLPRWGRIMHRALHLTLIWGLFLVALTGFLLGLTSATLLKAGGIVPIAPPMGWHVANDWIGMFHIVEFYALGGVAGLHAAFHIWRHTWLRDNALRIMAPRALRRLI